MATCNVNTCARVVWANQDECVLHTSKETDDWSRLNQTLAAEFYNALLDYIVEQIEDSSQQFLKENELRINLSQLGIDLISSDAERAYKGQNVDYNNI